METPASEAEPLSAAQREAVEQLMMVTAQDEAASTALLRRSGWSVPVAVTRFFDGDPEPEPDAGAPPPARVYQEALYAAMDDDHDSDRRRRPAVEHTEVARRIVVPPPAPVWRPPLLLALLLAPVHLGWRLVAGLWRAVQYVLGLLPGGLGLSLGSLMGGGGGARPRRTLAPRDAAARFRREFEEAYGSKALPFAETGYAQAYDQAKADPKFLLVVLLAPEHDDTARFARETLLHPDVVALVSDPASNLLLWGGSVRDPEAYQVALDLRVTKFPFAALVCVTPKEGAAGSSSGGSSTRMGTVKRIAGAVPAAQFVAQLRAAAAKYADDLAAVRAVRVANEASRSLRAEQDSAYERSLARDRARARARQEAEARERARREAAARHAQLRAQWRAWRAARLARCAPEPPAGTPDTVRVALKLPAARGGARLRRSFPADATVDDLYAFVECHEEEEGEEAEEEAEKTVDAPDDPPAGYTHAYAFRIASMMPREVLEPSATTTLRAAIGKGASLVVEEAEDDDSEEEGETSGSSAEAM